MIDIHNHLLVNVDDGPGSTVEAVDLLKQAAGQGITDVIVTPHYDEHRFMTPAEMVLEKISHLRDVIKHEQLDIKIHPGHEVRMSPELIEDLKQRHILTLNESRYLLIELSNADLPNYLENVMFDLQMEGYIPIIAHPERYLSFIEKKELLYRLVKKGMLIQITAGTVCGKEGKHLKNAVFKMMKDNLVHFVASDAHHRESRPFMLAEAYMEIERILGPDYAEELRKNAVSVLKDEEILIKAPRIEISNEKSRKNFLRYFKGK